MVSNEDKIFNDILSTNGISETNLSGYKFHIEDNINWLYTPLIIRNEDESIISGWSYVISGENILSSQVYIYGESRINSKPMKPFISNESLMTHYYEVEEIIYKNKQMFPDKVFEEKIIKILEKYFLEIIIQNSGYRIRIRSFMIQELAYDLYYEKSKDKLSFNLFNPIL